MIGGGVPKNFTQDVVVATEILGEEQPMHKYAMQITVADERDGALSRLDPAGGLLAGARSTRPTSRWSSARPRWRCR